MSDTLHLSAAFDRTPIWAKGGSYRYLVANVIAPEAVRDPTRERLPLNLALVLDRSGSMAGAPLEAAKEAAAGVVRTLRAEDHLTIVAFDSHVEAILPPTPMHHDGKTEALERLRQLDARATTNLSGGWLAAGDLVSQVAAQVPEARHRIVLLSDGMANAGVTEPAQLASMARELRMAGIYTSTVGIGDHYSTTQIQVLAEHGGGRLHDAETPAEIVEVVSAELEEMLLTTAEDVEVSLEVPEGVTVRCLSAFGCVEREGYHVASLGQMLSSGERSVVFEVVCPKGEVGNALEFGVRASWKDPDGGERKQAEAVTLSLGFVRGRDLKGLAPEPEIGLAVAQAWQASLMLRVATLNADGAFSQVRRLGETEGKYFLAYCRKVEGAEWLTLDLDFLFEHAVQPVSPRAQKEVWLRSAKMSRGEGDVRSAPRPDWKDMMGG